MPRHIVQAAVVVRGSAPIPGGGGLLGPEPSAGCCDPDAGDRRGQ